MMKRHLILAYGAAAYAAFFAAILYLIGFVGNFGVPRSLDSGPEGPLGAALLVNTLLVALFAVQHTIMARPEFKARWTKIIPPAAERSTFVLAASACLALLFWLWRPIPGTLWEIEAPAGRLALNALCLLGFGLVFYASFLIDHFDLFGLRQVWLHWRGEEYTHPRFKSRSLYRMVRHPLMVGFLIAFWATPTMTAGHLAFAVLLTAYILFGVAVEERDLLRFHGEDYANYRRAVPMFIPRPRRAVREEADAE